ncbi:class I SAM-dependent methyltransferase [Paenibacillus motobuensis]|uniref:Class I SAM-dependent methyltransferase n=1 Tax=Paenibacillus motobuensis TaxID=295324 RepID=A0ABP3I921_9BACL
MSEYYWDSQVEYLRNTRCLYYNDDYLEFLVKIVWKIDRPVKIIDFGCGYGYLGLKFLPLLPEGSTYTGIDRGSKLIQTAREIYGHQKFETEFIEADIEEVVIARDYDIAMCHAFLLHMTDSRAILQKMIDSVQNHGRIICFEPHWIANMSNYYMVGIEQSRIIRLGLLQQLYEEDARLNGKDGNIGIMLPIMLSQMGLHNVECRVSDKVNFLDQNMEPLAKDKLYQSLIEEGLGQIPGNRNEVVERLKANGLPEEEAVSQYNAELLFSESFGVNSWLAYAPNMKITYGTVNHD